MTGQALLGYQLEDIQANNGVDIPVTPAQLEQWLADRPLLNTSQLAQEIPEYLQQMNQIAIADKLRLHMLEMLRQLVDHLYKTLSKQMLGSYLNLSEKAQHIHWVLNVMLGEMATGYQRLLFNKARRDPGWLNRKAYVMLAERVAYYRSEQIMLAYQSSRMVSHQIWQTLHTTWNYAQVFKLTAVTIPDEYAFFPEKAGTIDILYKRALLLSMVSPYHLRSAELAQIYYGLVSWVDGMELSQATFPAKPGFYVNLSGDQGVRFLHIQDVTKNDMAVDTTALQQQLSAWLQTGHGPKSAQYKGMSTKLLEDVLSCLDGSRRRLSERIANPGEQIEGVFGLTEIKALLQERQQTANYQERILPEKKTEPVFAIDSDWEQRGDESGWSGLHYYTPPPPSAKPTMPPLVEDTENTVKTYPLTVVNESQNGVCLICHDRPEGSVYVGQLLLMRGHEMRQWTLGSIRWMCMDNTQLKTGVFLLSADVNCVRVNKQNSHQSQEISVLHLGDGDGNYSLLLTQSDFEMGDELELMTYDAQGTIILSDIIWHSEGFAQFRYTVS